MRALLCKHPRAPCFPVACCDALARLFLPMCRLSPAPTVNEVIQSWTGGNKDPPLFHSQWKCTGAFATSNSPHQIICSGQKNCEISQHSEHSKCGCERENCTTVSLKKKKLYRLYREMHLYGLHRLMKEFYFFI